MRARCLAAWVLVAAAAGAQPADLPDAGLPDASVDATGAERASEEEEDGRATPCLQDRDCDRGFLCTDGRCTWQRPREATFVGCSGAPAGWPAVALALALGAYFRVKRTK